MFSTVLLLLFYLTYLANFGGLKPTGFSLSSLTGLDTSGLLALLSLSFALIALYLPRVVKSPAAVIVPLLASGATDFYLSLGVPFEFFLILYAVVPFIASGIDDFVFSGAFVAFAYAIAVALSNNPELWVPFLLLIPLGVVYWASRGLLASLMDAIRADVTVLTLLFLLPFPLVALSTNSTLALLPYLSAMTILMLGMVMMSRGKGSKWPFVVSGVITYFTPIALTILLHAYTSNSFLNNSAGLFFLGSLALFFYLKGLLSVDDSDVVIFFTPILLGITVATIEYFKATYYFLSLGPWLVALVAMPKSPSISKPFAVLGAYRSYPQPYRSQQAAQKPAYVRFIIRGLPPTALATLTVGSSRCDGNAVTDCYDFGNWRAYPVQVGNVVYYPSPDSGVAIPGSTIYIDYSPVPTPSPQSAQAGPAQSSYNSVMAVRFIIRGLPPMARAKVIVGSISCDGDSVIDCNAYGRWAAYPVQVGQLVYYPNPNSGYANPGDTVTIYYSLAPQQVQAQQPSQTFTYAPSRPLAKVSPTQFDPNTLVNRRLGVYKVKSLIGSGGFGYVYLGDMSGKKFAIKVLKLDKGDPVAYFRDLFHEANNLVDLSNHPNIVRVYAVNVDLNVIEEASKGNFGPYYADPPRIVMEYMEGGSLDNYLTEDTFFYSSGWETVVKKAVRQVADALAHVHGKGYVHLDVKPQNVFLTRKPRDPSDLLSVDFKLGDLGSAVRAGKDVMQVTPEYSPPEVLTSKASPSMDVFALGITLYVLLTRKNDRPDIQVMNEAFDCYVNNDTNCVKRKVEEAKRLLASWDPQVPEPYKSLVKAMTNPDPAKRPTALDVGRWLA